MKETIYPGIMERVKAVFIDSFLLIMSMILITDIFSGFEAVPNYLRIIAFIVVFILYDPLCTSVFGGTFGHMAIGIPVKRSRRPNKNILLLHAVLPYLAKTTLGWISLRTVTGNEKRQAKHDFLGGSVVLYKEG